MGKMALLIVTSFALTFGVISYNTSTRVTSAVALNARQYNAIQAKNASKSAVEVYLRNVAKNPTSLPMSLTIGTIPVRRGIGNANGQTTGFSSDKTNGRATGFLTNLGAGKYRVKTTAFPYQYDDLVVDSIMVGISISGSDPPLVTGALSVSYGAKAGIKTSNTTIIDGHNYDINGNLSTAYPDVAGLSVAQLGDVTITSSGTLKINGKGAIDPDIEAVTGQPDYYAMALSLIPLADTVFNNVNISKPLTLGTIASPKITYCTGTVAFSQTVTGAGILIVDGKFSNTNTFNWNGIIMIVGDPTGSKEQAKFTNGSPIVGAIIMSGAQVKFEQTGTTNLKYSYEAINNAWTKTRAGSGGKKVVLTQGSWKE